MEKEEKKEVKTVKKTEKKESKVEPKKPKKLVKKDTKTTEKKETKKVNKVEKKEPLKENIIIKEEEKINEKKTIDKEINKKDHKNEINNSYVFPIVLLMIVAITIIALPNIDKAKEFLKDTFEKKEVTTTTTTTRKTTTTKKINKADKTGAVSPVLTKDLVPIRYNQVTNKWVKADTANPSDDYWFNYETKEWANAVLVRENGTKTRDYYLNANDGIVINEEDILAYFVWIPRYSYLIDETNKIVDIKFESTTTKKSNGDGKTTYLTHPIFTYNGKELSGIWVGKYEVTGSTNDPTILNTNSLSYKNIAAMIDSLNSASQKYNLFNTKINLIKNTEWGAMTYLAYSKYGVCTDYVCSFNELDSTTNNITGIFKVNNGSEYVMGNYGNAVSYSGLNYNYINENPLYFDLYNESNLQGDATSDLSNIYINGNAVFNTYNSWYVRGNGSIFAYAPGTGAPNYYIGYRVVLH